MNCDVCKEYFSEKTSYDLHLDSEKHKRNFQLSALLNDAILPTLLACKNLREKTCGEDFNKIVSCKDGEYETKASEQHRKLEQSFLQYNTENNKLFAESSSLSNSVSPSVTSTGNFTSRTTDSLYCDICDKFFSGPIPLEQHMQSQLHDKKKKRKECEGNSQFNILRDNMHDRSSSKFSPWFCEVCLCNCSGPLPFQQHLASEMHKKRIQRKNLLEGNVNCNEDIQNSNQVKQYSTSQLYCEICSMSFTGPIPHQSHMIGAAHQKNIRKYETGNKLNVKTCSQNNIVDSTIGIDYSKQNPLETNVSCSKDIYSSNKVNLSTVQSCCEICDKSFNGPIPYQAHMTSVAHQKNLRKNENCSSQNNTVDSTTCTSYLKQNPLLVSNCENVKTAIENITVFSSDEEINFDISIGNENEMDVDAKPNINAQIV